MSSSKLSSKSTATETGQGTAKGVPTSPRTPNEVRLMAAYADHRYVSKEQNVYARRAKAAPFSSYDSYNDNPATSDGRDTTITPLSSTAVSLDDLQRTVFESKLSSIRSDTGRDRDRMREWIDRKALSDATDATLSFYNSGHSTTPHRNYFPAPTSKVGPFAVPPPPQAGTTCDDSSEPEDSRTSGPEATGVDAQRDETTAESVLGVIPPESGLNSASNELSFQEDSFSTLGSHKGHHRPAAVVTGSWPAASKGVVPDRDTNEKRHDHNESSTSGHSQGQEKSEARDGQNPSEALPLTNIGTHAKAQSVLALDESAQMEVPRPMPSATTSKDLLHAPIPISKIRPFIQSQTSNVGDPHAHRITPKVTPAVGLLGSTSAAPTAPPNNLDNLARPKSQRTSLVAASRTSSNYSQPLSSLTDYTRTAQWLRDVLKYPETYTSKYTTRPGRIDRARTSSPEHKGRSSSIPACAAPSKPRGRVSLASGTNSDNIDGVEFTRAVSDFERLLSEALTLATRVVDHPASSPSQNSFRQPLKSPRSRSQSLVHRVRVNSPRSALTSPTTDGSGDFGSTAGRDKSQPSADQQDTKSAQPRLARKSNFVKSLHYVRGENEVVAKTDQVPRADLEVPRRKSSRKLDALSLETAAIPKDSRPHAGEAVLAHGLGSGAQDLADRGKGQAHLVRPPGAESLRPNRRAGHLSAASQESVVQGVNATEKRLRADHVISLRRRSHVSLRGAQGFSLAKSHGRQPVARDWSTSRKRFVASVACLSTGLVGILRLTNPASWTCLLLVSRAVMGVSLGFASMNFHSVLTDLFGASLMSCNPHQEVVDDHDARRHGGGMGVWLGIWTWCWIGSLGIGFLTGACIIDSLHPAWGFYVSIMIIAVVVFLNVLCPEVRRSAYRRSVAEVRSGGDVSRRLARGEIMMHRVKTGPRWWGQEVYHGVALNLEMLRQPGFAVMTIYSAWIYAQVVLIIILLGSLVSRIYHLRSTEVGLFVGVMALGAVLAIPFQKANLFSRSRQAQLNSNLATLERKVAWSSHLVRRTVFTLLLPISGICYTAVSSGPPIHVSVPTIFSGLVGFLSCLAISECNGLVMEAFDCSDLSPGMIGRQKGASGKSQKRTNYSSFPRVTAGFACIHSLAFFLAAGATALGGYVTRTLGQQVSTGVVAGILLILTLLLLAVLIRFTEVQIVPRSRSAEMDRLVDARRRSTIRRVSMPYDPQAVIEEEKAWRPVMIGNPTNRTRRMNVFELGGMTRWQEVRRKNKLIDAGAHLNWQALDQGMEALDDQLSDFRRNAHDLLHSKKQSARRLRRTNGSSDQDKPIEMKSLGSQSRHDEFSQANGQQRACALSRTTDQGSDENRGRKGQP
ncbi:Major facilitator superfamily domain, general substrate transporter [Moelleriella libera RCEF 2490]|uniref:Major facilitator superfamily domain, general substrate transporter n=1 Tax=Moelleriella libera RCEF 2490 TaxID=1081109 RepID=A0A166V7T4_9HYPO|nr:Major facilitator superfamily domain, general substrate transporter [Moelleriella libera RCEF 2490]